MRHGYTTMEEIRNNMAHQLDAETMMHLTGYRNTPYDRRSAEELIAEEVDMPDYFCRETILYAFDYAVTRWSCDVMALNILIDAWMNTEEEE